MEFALNITKHGCRIVCALVDALDEPGAYERALASVSAYRRAKAKVFRFEKDRHLSLLAGMLLDKLLRERGLAERDMAYIESELGKPSFAGLPSLYFSLAHSGRMAAAALADHPIGIDVEHLPSFAYDLADPHEWTTMEAVGKALGCGVGLFVDGEPFAIPDDFEIEHFDCGRYLVCVAQRLQ